MPAAPPIPHETRGLTGLWVSGVVTASVVYLTTVIMVPALADPSVAGQSLSYVITPVAGPFILLASPLDLSQYVGPLVISGLLQAAGVIMTVVGLAVRRPVEQPGTIALGSHRDAPTLQLTPLLGQAVSGMQITMRF